MPDLKTELSKVAPAFTATNLREAVDVEDDPKIQRVRASCSPVYVAQLADKVGHIQAARSLGYSDNAINTAIKRDVISLTAELLAFHLLQSMQPKEATAEDRLFIVKVPADKADGFGAICSAMGIAFKDLNAL